MTNSISIEKPENRTDVAGSAVEPDVRPLWSSKGAPLNAEAAMSDALLWLDITPAGDAVNRERLGACKAALMRFGAIYPDQYS